MGMQIFEKSGTFNPQDWGLKIGDMLQVIVVGGGASGGISNGSTPQNGNAGKSSSFGSYVTAEGGNTDFYKQNGMGRGGSNNTNNVSGASGGAGGFELGVPIIGGDGTSPVYTNDTGYVNHILAPTRLAGIGSINGTGNYTIIGNVDFANVGSGVSGNRGSGSASLDYKTTLIGAGGNGYGAGGAGVSNYGKTNTRAGNSGQLVIASVLLENLNAITVTVGTGGNEVSLSSYYSGKGADGVVIVTW